MMGNRPLAGGDRHDRCPRVRQRHLHAYGPDAVRFYTKRKTITQRWPSAGVREGAVFSFPSSR